MRIYKLNDERVSVTDFFSSLRQDCAREAEMARGNIANAEFDSVREEIFEAKKELVKRGKIVRFENASGNEYWSRRFYYTPAN